MSLIIPIYEAGTQAGLVADFGIAPPALSSSLQEPYAAHGSFAHEGIFEVDLGGSQLVPATFCQSSKSTMQPALEDVVFGYRSLIFASHKL